MIKCLCILKINRITYEFCDWCVVVVMELMGGGQHSVPLPYSSSTIRRSSTSTDSTVPRIGGASIVLGVNVTVCELLCTES